jgi:dTDP-4-dehydrorhamnose reductase
VTVKTLPDDRPTVLLLGGSGLLGSHCKKELASKYRVVSTWCRHPVPGEGSEHFDALSDKEALCALLERTAPALVINTIAYVTVDGCEENPEMAYRLNVDFVRNLVSAMRDVGARASQLIHISSDSVYGNRDVKRAWQEEDIKRPLSVYARTKLQSEEAALSHAGPVTVLRTAFYGINPYSNVSLLSWIIENARSGVPMNGWENIYFSPISAQRLALGIRVLFEGRVGGIFNTGSLDSCSKYDFVGAVCDYLNIPATIHRSRSTRAAGQAIRPEFSALDSRKLATAIPWEVTWREDLYAYLQQMPSF